MASTRHLPTGWRGHRLPSAMYCSGRDRGPSSAMGSSQTPVFTAQAGLPRLFTVHKAVNSLGPTVSSTRSKIRVRQETTDGRTCWRRPAETQVGSIASGGAFNPVDSQHFSPQSGPVGVENLARPAQPHSFARSSSNRFPDSSPALAGPLTLTARTVIYLESEPTAARRTQLFQHPAATR